MDTSVAEPSAKAFCPSRNNWLVVCYVRRQLAAGSIGDVPESSLGIPPSAATPLSGSSRSGASVPLASREERLQKQHNHFAKLSASRVSRRLLSKREPLPGEMWRCESGLIRGHQESCGRRPLRLSQPPAPGHTESIADSSRNQALSQLSASGGMLGVKDSNGAIC